MPCVREWQPLHLFHVALLAVHQTDKSWGAIDPEAHSISGQPTTQGGPAEHTGSPDDLELLRELLRHRIHRCKCVPITLCNRQTVPAPVEHTFGRAPAAESSVARAARFVAHTCRGSRTKFASVVLDALLPMAFDIGGLDIEPELVYERVACVSHSQTQPVGTDTLVA